MTTQRLNPSAMDGWRNGDDFGQWEYVVKSDYEYTDRSLPTASAWVKYTIKAGVYPIRLTNIGGSDWNPDRSAVTPGFIANTGPYYAVAETDAIRTESYYVNTLFTASSVDHKTGLDEITHRSFSWYAYEMREEHRDIDTLNSYVRKVA